MPRLVGPQPPAPATGGPARPIRVGSHLPAGAHVALAKASLGGRDVATRWLKRPNRALGGKAPLAVIDTEPGARMVENVLGRIAFGGVS